MNIYGQTPYTYLLYCIPLDKIYYGVRVGNRVSPKEDLWHVYFSSSTRIKKLRIQFGDAAFVASVRKTFNSRERAFIWEEKVLEKLFSKHRSKLINVKITSSSFCNNPGYTQSVDHIRKRADGLRKRWDDPDFRKAQLALIRQPERQAKVIQAVKDRWKDPKRREALTERNNKRWANAQEKERHIMLKSKTYRIILPTGEERIIRNLTKFAKDNSIGLGSLQKAKRLNTCVAGYYVSLLI